MSDPSGVSDQAPRRLFPRKEALSLFVVALTFLAATLIYTRPLIRSMTTHMVFFGGDTALNAYILAWGQHALLTHPLGAFDANFLYPQSNTLALSDNQLGAALLALPLAPFRNPILVYNVLFLASYFLTALLWYVVLKRWGLRTLAAWTGAFCFAFLPWRLSQLSHVQLLYTWWIPLALAGVEAWTRSERWLPILVAAFSLGASFYTGIYNTLFLILFLAPFGLAGFVAMPPWRRSLRRFLAQAGVGALLFLLMIAPALPAYFDIKDKLGSPNTLELVSRRGASLMDYFRNQGQISVYRWRESRPPNLYTDVEWEQQLFLGFMTMALALSLAPARWMMRRRSHAEPPRRLDRLALMLLAGGATLFVVSLGPEFHWRGRVAGPPLPYVLLYRYFPGFDALRVPARAALFVGLALSGLVAIALHFWLTMPGARRRWAGRLIAVAGVALLIAEFHSDGMPAQRNNDYERHLEVQRAIGELPKGAILVLPLEDRLNYLIPLTSVPHFYPVLNGVSGHLPSQNGRIFDSLKGETWGAIQERLLRRLGVRYLVVDLTFNSEPPPAVLRNMPRVLERLGFKFKAREFDNGKIILYQIEPSPRQK